MIGTPYTVLKCMNKFTLWHFFLIMKKSNFTRLGIQMGFGIYSACIRNANIVKKHFI